MKVIQICFGFNQHHNSVGGVFELDKIIFDTESHSLAQDSLEFIANPCWRVPPKSRDFNVSYHA